MRRQQHAQPPPPVCHFEAIKRQSRKGWPHEKIPRRKRKELSEDVSDLMSSLDNRSNTGGSVIHRISWRCPYTEHHVHSVACIRMCRGFGDGSAWGLPFQLVAWLSARNLSTQPMTWRYVKHRAGLSSEMTIEMYGACVQQRLDYLHREPLSVRLSGTRCSSRQQNIRTDSVLSPSPVGVGLRPAYNPHPVLPMSCHLRRTFLFSELFIP